ncbi:MAG: M13 family metallopeptidase [Bacteroidaceae bacterium]|nr:M13 family metallopeptidase [Bacteroidaceae bacterium]
MKLKNLLAIMAILSLLAACTGQQKSLTTGIDLANLDTTAVPGTDFFRFATGGWNDAHPLTAEYARFGSFDQLAENNNTQLRELIENVAAQQNQPGSIADKIAQMYNSVMDSVSLNKQGIEPIRKDLQRIDGVYDKPELFRLYAGLQAEGIDGLFGYYINADIKNSAMNLLQIWQDGLVMGQKEYYLDTDSATTAIREAYKQYMAKLFLRCKVATEEEMDARVRGVLDLETRLARISRSRTELRDDEKNYNKMSYDSLLATFPGIDWNFYFSVQGAKGIKEVSVGQPEVIHEIEAIWQQADLAVLKDYVRWQLINAAAGCLDDETRAANFDFFGRAMQGKQEDRPRWKRAVSATQGALGEAIGQLYVEKYFPAAAKERMIQLVRNLQVALGQRIDAQDWMSDSTKAVAHEKLDAFIVKVGYPDKWKDYSELEIGRNFWENVKATALWRTHDEIRRKLNQPVDNTEWYMTPQTVNAYYNPTTNEICFPAGILQPPFFDMQADDAFNYGAIGVVIGHEMTHGFDDQGAKFDKDGNLRQWWTEEDTRRFEERTHVMRDFFNNIEVLPGLCGNGQLTLGENMADHGGLQVAFQAFKNATAAAPLKDEDGFTPEQRFFLAYAGVWAGNVRDEEIRNRTKSDPHSLGRWRVNGALPHIDAWYEAFHITESDPMFVPKADRVTIW